MDPTLPDTFPSVADNFRGPCMYEVRPEWRSGRGRWWRAVGQGYTDDVTQAGIYDGPDGVSGSERSYAVSADLVRSYLRPTPAVDPTLPGIPNDQLVHAANVERARVLIHHDPVKHKSHCGPACALCAEVRDIAEALTAAELRGFEKGVGSVKGAPTPSVRRTCRTCAHDDGAGDCAPHSANDREVLRWYSTLSRDGRTGGDGYPHPDADNCPGWAAKETT